MKKFLFALFTVAALFWAQGAQAAGPYYYLDCGTGADALCAANIGSDANTPCTNAALPCRTSAAARTRINSLAAGEQVLFARGGAWNDSYMALQNTSTTATNPITIGAYTPSWCVGACASTAPILNETRVDTDGLAFDVAGADGGYIVQDLELRGGSTGRYGIFTSQGVTDMVVRRMNINGFQIGMHCGQSLPRYQLLNSNLSNNPDQGILWACDDSLIEGNIFDNNGTWGCGASWAGNEENCDRLHNVYLNPDTNVRNITVRGNTLTRNSRYTAQRCRSVPLVVHGQIAGLVIENNRIIEETTAMKTGCWGIAVDTGYPTPEHMRNVIIRGNTLVNVGSVAIGVAATPNVIIENNVIVLQTPTGSGAMTEYYGILAPDTTPGAGDDTDTGHVIRNNSFYLYYGPTDMSAITPGEYTYTATAVTIASNLIYLGTGVSATHSCFDTGAMTLGSFTAFVNNLCYHANGNGRWSITYSTLANAQAAGWDLGGLSTNPDIIPPTSANDWKIEVNAGSPAIGAANSTYKSRLGFGGCPVTGARDIGAAEYGCSP